MSETTVLKLKIGGSPEDLEDLRNSHGSAPVIWNEMCKKHLGSDDHGYYGVIEKLWPLYKDKAIPKHQRTVLAMTYDRAYVSKENYKQAAKDIRSFLVDFPLNPDYVNHWPRIAEIFESEPDCEAIGLHCTSVSENPFYGDWNEEKEDYDVIDWETALDIYQELKS